MECPICLNVFEGKCVPQPSTFDGREFLCDACGRFRVSGTASADLFESGRLRASKVQRAFVSQKIAAAQSGSKVPMIVSSWLNDALANAKLPSPPEQARRVIEIIGDYVSKFGEPMPAFGPAEYAVVGAIDRARFNRVVEELALGGSIFASGIPDTFDGPGYMQDLDLTFSGWAEYEARKKGLGPGTFGFLAMHYGDPILEKFVAEVVKPAVRSALLYELVDMRDVAEAGIIDNLMRQRIRDSSFVLADLTHDNPGAYWEAGYAEGLGKPVIYLCEVSKFAKAKSHFDTNHSTTVLWSTDTPKQSTDELIATIRRSLNLFP